ncbi:hypothetical protein RugamoR64_55690 [Duganella rhizosphaerae]|uniref:FtsX-like permease family protein n=1 Tax=Duganella rhizosphaerae TaxID=2885763 RepID=UPI0030E9617C
MIGATLHLLAIFLRAHRQKPLRFFIFLFALAAPTILLSGGLAFFSAFQQRIEQIPADRYLVMESAAAVETHSFFPAQIGSMAAALMSSEAGLDDSGISAAIALDVNVENPARSALTAATLRGISLTGNREYILRQGRWPREGSREVLLTQPLFDWLAEHGGTTGGVVLAGRRWDVVGVTTSPFGGGDWDIVTSLQTAQTDFDMAGVISSLSLRLPNGGEARTLTALRTALGRVHEKSLELVQYRRQVEQVTANVKQGVLWLWRCVLCLVVFCAGLAQAMLAGVIAFERGSAYATLHAIGFSHRQIEAAAVLEGALLGAAGAALAMFASGLAMRQQSLKIALPGADLDMSMQSDWQSCALVLMLAAALGGAAFYFRRRMAGAGMTSLN